MNSVVVLLSTYNGEKYLEQQIDSILAQQDVSIRIFVRDDGSSDGTISILKRYESEGNLKWIKGNNVGCKNSFWELLMQAGEADFYAFSDQDDCWKPNKISSAIKWLKEKDHPALYCAQVELADKNLVPLSVQEPIIKVTDFSVQSLFVRHPSKVGRGCTMVWNRCLQSVITSREKLTNIVEHDVTLFLIASLVGEVFIDSQRVLFYRQHEDNLMGASVGLNKWKRYFNRTKAKWNRLVGNTAEKHDRELLNKKIYEEFQDVILNQYKQDFYMVAHYRESLKNYFRVFAIKAYKGVTIQETLFAFLRILLHRI